MESRLLLNAVRYSKIMVAATLTTALPTLFLEDPTNYAQELIEAKQQMQIEGNRNFDSVLKNPHVVGELLRYYLANCPSALFTSAQYDAWLIVAMVKAPMERIRSYQSLLAQLPVTNRSSIKKILTLFHTIHSSKAWTASSSTLAELFGPVIFRPERKLYYMNDDPALLATTLRELIESAPAIFPDSEDILLRKSENDLSRDARLVRLYPIHLPFLYGAIPGSSPSGPVPAQRDLHIAPEELTPSPDVPDEPEGSGMFICSFQGARA